MRIYEFNFFFGDIYLLLRNLKQNADLTFIKGEVYVCTMEGLHEIMCEMRPAKDGFYLP